MEDLFECKCGCNQFLTITPHQYKKQDINNWASFGLRVQAGIAPVLICLNCGFVTIPPISMSGKSRLDPNVQAFGNLMKWVEEHNKPKPEHVCKCDTKQIATIGHIWGEPTPGFDNDGDKEVSKLDKQTMPTKDEFGPGKVRNQEPRNKEKAPVKTKRVAKPKTQKKVRTTAKETTDV